jgi:hypothetical protein
VPVSSTGFLSIKEDEFRAQRSSRHPPRSPPLIPPSVRVWRNHPGSKARLLPERWEPSVVNLVSEHDLHDMRPDILRRSVHAFPGNDWKSRRSQDAHEKDDRYNPSTGQPGKNHVCLLRSGGVQKRPALMVIEEEAGIGPQRLACLCIRRKIAINSLVEYINPLLSTVFDKCSIHQNIVSDGRWLRPQGPIPL